MRLIALFALLLFLQNPIYAQQFGSHKVALTPKTKPINDFNRQATEAAIRRQYVNDFKTESDLEDFVQYITTYKKQIFNSSYIYSNLPEVSAYLKEILNRVIPARLRDTALKVYIVRDPSFNASVMGDGSVFVNIGLLSVLNNEAEIAAVLGHEFGHFDARHILKRYKTMKKYKADLKGNAGGIYNLLSVYGHMRKLSQKYIENELESDNYAIKLMRENGFAPAAMSNNFEMFNKIERKYASFTGNHNNSYFHTHPSNQKRIENVESQFTQDELKRGSKYFYDSLQFINIRNRAIDECINLHFEAKNYTECIEMAFRQHLFYPKDEYYLFFIIESLHRQLKLYEDFYKQYFITWRYRIDVANVKTSTFPKHIQTLQETPVSDLYKKSIFYHLDDYVLNLTASEMQEIKNKDMLKNDTLEFITNMDALQYFRKILPPGCEICNLVFKENPGVYEGKDFNRLTDIEQKYIEWKKLKDSFDSARSTFVNQYSIIFSIDSRSNLGPYSSLNYNLEEKLREGYTNYLNEKAQKYSGIKSLNGIGFRDEYDLNNSCSLVAGMYSPESNGKIYQTEFNYFKVDPELAIVATNCKAKKIVFTDIELQTDIQVGADDEEDNYIKCRYKVYCMDVLENKLRYQAGKIYIKSDSSFNELYEAINEVFWILVK